MAAQAVVTVTAGDDVVVGITTDGVVEIGADDVFDVVERVLAAQAIASCFIAIEPNIDALGCSGVVDGVVACAAVDDVTA